MPVSIPLPSNRGNISYGPVIFDAATETTDLSFKVVYTEDRRWVKHTEVSITLRGYVTTNTDPNQTTDQQMNAIRQSLEAPGLAFVYTSGVGDFSINTNAKSWSGSTPTQDILFGPMPQLIRFKPLGNNKAAKVFWSVIVTLAECPNKVYVGIKEFGYKLTWQIQKGLTRRTHTGHVEIMNNFVAPGQRVTRDSADAYRNIIATFPIPNGFHRLAPQTYNLSGNRSRLDFSITDESLPNYNVPPPGALSAKFNHTIQVASLYGVKFVGSMSGEYTFPRNINPMLGYYYFWRAVLNRLRITAANQQPVPNAKGIKGNAIILTSFRMEESDAYGDQVARFTMGYWFTTTLDSLLAASALWTPMPDSNYNSWVAALGPVFGDRGFDGLGFGPGEAVISLCQPSTSPPTRQPGGPTGGQQNPAGTGPGGIPQNPQAPGGGGGFPGGNPRGGGLPNIPGLPNFPFGIRFPSVGFSLPGLGGGFAPNPFPPPDPPSSWIYFESEIFLEQRDALVEMKPLPSVAINPDLVQSLPVPQPGAFGSIVGTSSATSPGMLNTQTLNITGPGTSVTGEGNIDIDTDVDDDYSGLPPGAVPPPVVEVRAAPTYYVWLIGKALRANYLIAPPVLTTVGGKKVVPANIEGCGFGQKIVGILGGVPVIGAHWKYRYLVRGTPKGIGIPTTPMA